MDNRPPPHLFDAVNRYRWSSLCLVLVIMVISIAVAAVTGSRGSQATTYLVLKAPAHSDVVGTDLTGSDLISEGSFVRYMQQRTLFLTSDRVLNKARGLVPGAPSVEDLRTEITAVTATTGESITVTVSDRSDQAVAITNAIVRAYRDLSGADAAATANQALASLSAQRTRLLAGAGPASSAGRSALNQELTNLNQQSSAIGVAATQFGDGVAFANNATVPPSTLLQDLARDAAIGLVVGLLAAAALAWARADRDQRIRDGHDLEAVGGKPLMAEIEEFSERSAPPDARARPLPRYQLAMSGLRSAVPAGVVVLTGSMPGAGTTTSTLQLATAAAHDGARVCVVDAAARTHQLSNLLDFGTDAPGLTGLATGKAALADCAHRISLGDDTALWLVPASDDPTVGFKSALLEKAISELRAAYDLVFIDTPPVTEAPEIATFVRESDAVVIVVRQGETVPTLDRVRERVALLDGTIGGYLLTFANRVPSRRGATPPVTGAPR